ncbi:glycosyltransferase family 2 protein [Streptomyces nitrosporeus]|uniref:Glycosyltransferase family 2 protein n=1 Tax=Streptomyces nitrosporeus TaxID=28894 RepID=A0A5J6FJF7_9ACTN|nr:glycosyltransferase family 2 protein [Streptomyces nitrosporeus]QEU76528.1 glycosyltransferase family 2 protein [Streptomyces nitrosporeus]
MVELSVIVPFYNVRAYAPDTLRCLRANAGEDIEFVLVDDCSTDGTAEILRLARDGLPGAVLHRHERNRGLASARNTGLDAARGRYLAFLDGDDWVAPGHYARLLSETVRLGCDFVRTDHVQVTGVSRTVRRVPHGLRGVVGCPRDAILPAGRTTSVDYAFAWAGLYHRRLLEKGLLHFTDGLRTAEDRPWIWRLHREAESFAVLGVLGNFYRRGVASSLTQIRDVRQLDFLRAFDQVVEETAADRDAEKLLPKAVRAYCAVLSHHVNALDTFEPPVARALRSRGAAALGRLPRQVLDEALDSMDVSRSAPLRRLRRRPLPGKGTAAA